MPNDTFVSVHPNPDTLQYIRDKLDKKAAEELITKCVHAIMILSQGKDCIAKAALVAAVFPANTYHQITRSIIEIANIKLARTFGMRLYETDTKYLLVNATTDDSMLIDIDKEDTKFFAILNFILIDLFGCTDERLTIDEIARSLEPLNITREDLEELLKSYIEKNYLCSFKEDAKTYYRWGQRALAEVEPDDFFQAFISLHRGTASDYPDLAKKIDLLKNIRNGI